MNSKFPLILMYHRISDPCLDPWGLCVSPRDFRLQMQELSRTHQIIKLSDIHRHKEFTDKAVITFDDGYADNLFLAAPILEELSLPASIFVTTGYIGGQKEFWWDALEQLLLLPGELPNSLNLDVPGTRCQFTFGKHRRYTEELALSHFEWKVTYDGTPPPTERHELFLILWRILKRSPDHMRMKIITYLYDWGEKAQEVRSNKRPMTARELIEVSCLGNIEIGSHCVTHGALTEMDSATKKAELEGSKTELERILGRPIDSLAYPHGEYDREIIRLAELAKYSCALGIAAPLFSDLSQIYQLSRSAPPSVANP